MTNVFVQNLCFYRARFSIQSLFKITPCPLKGQRENHTGVLASDSSHDKTVHRRSITKRPFASKAVYICAENLMVGWLQVKSWDITVGSQLMLKIFYSWKRICIYLGVFVDCLRIINARSLSHVSIIAGFRHCELRSARRSTFFSDSFCQPFLGFAGNKFFVLVTKMTRLDGDGLAELWEAWEKWCLANVSNGTCARHFVLTCNNKVPQLAFMLCYHPLVQLLKILAQQQVTTQIGHFAKGYICVSTCASGHVGCTRAGNLYL